MPVQIKIQNKVSRFEKPARTERVKYTLENQWISINDDLPCYHKELLINPRFTKYVIVKYKEGYISFDRMVKISDGYWKFAGAVTHWMPIPKEYGQYI